MAELAKDFFPLDPLYLNERRVAALTGVDVFIQSMGESLGFEKRNEHLRALKTAEVLRDWIVQEGEPIPSVQAAYLTDSLKLNQLVTYEGNLWSRNARGRNPRVKPLAYSMLKGVGPDQADVRFELELYPEHVVVGSAGERLTGQLTDMFVLAQITDLGRPTVRAKPIFIGYLGEYAFMGAFYPTRRNELFLEDIDSFAEVRKAPRPKKEDLEVLREIPELDVKVAFAEILGETTVPKDWGGEKSDLYSTRVQIEGRRISTAFLFKGPAGGSKFREMRISDLGKNGDQIERLCNEPADLLVVQHCHMIGTAVRSTTRAFCNQVGRPRRYCFLTGLDTVRLLRAYGKCGLSAARLEAV